jgi:hypothetical protein
VTKKAPKAEQHNGQKDQGEVKVPNVGDAIKSRGGTVADQPEPETWEPPKRPERPADEQAPDQQEEADQPDPSDPQATPSAPEQNNDDAGGQAKF